MPTIPTPSSNQAPAPYTEESYVPVATPRTRAMRTFLPWQLFRFIVLPHLRPVLVVCALFRLIDSFKAFPLIYVLTNGGPGTVTEVTNYYGFIEAFNFSYWGYASAIAMVILTGVFALSWFVGRLGWSQHEHR